MKLQVIKQRNFWWIFSLSITVAGLIAMMLSWQQIGAPLRPSLDFVGGTRLQVELDCSQPQNCDRPITLETVRQVLDDQGLAGSSIQIVGDKQQAVSVRTRSLDVEKRNQLQVALSDKLGKFDPTKTQIDSVGPTLGRQLFNSGMLALVLSFAGIVAYLAVRFQLDYAVMAIIALLHDVLITISVFAILGLVAGVEVDSLFIVALLTIVGFSVNDTVVIYDRIRETLKLHPHQHINEIVDDSVNQTLTRSINTSLTAMLPLLAIMIFGGETLKFFALALLVGFGSGVYSSIFIASTLIAWWRERTGQAILAPVAETGPADALES